MVTHPGFFIFLLKFEVFKSEDLLQVSIMVTDSSFRKYVQRYSETLQGMWYALLALCVP